jgi:hypothetical protein
LILRTERDWNRDVKPIAISDDGNTFRFQLRSKQPFLYFKPCLELTRLAGFGEGACAPDNTTLVQ